MKFVLGKPHKLVEACWYLVVDCRDAEMYVASILRNNSMRFATDPHRGDLNAHLATISMQRAMLFDFGMHERNGWFVGRMGGMCPNLVEVLKEVESESWPEAQRISISRWPNGKHYYAKVDEQDVVWEGLNKWGTERAAQKAAEAFMVAKDKR